MGIGGMGMGAGYGMGGMGRYGGYAGGHHGYRGSSMRLPWLGALAATAVAAGAASVYPRGARSNVSWKEGSKQMSAQVCCVLCGVCCSHQFLGVVFFFNDERETTVFPQGDTMNQRVLFGCADLIYSMQ